MKSHEFARMLLDLPNLELGINYDGEFNGLAREPFIQRLGGESGELYVLADAFGGELPALPLNEEE